MRLTHFQATAVHGYLKLNVEFYPDLTFITGLNGSGKTTALRLLMGLLTPNLEELSAIKYATALVRVVDKDQEIVLTATRTSEGLTLASSQTNEALSLTAAELQLLSEARQEGETNSPIEQKVNSNPVFQAIAQISTPMFLGLDRRFYIGRGLAKRSWRLPSQHRYAVHSALLDEDSPRGPAASLGDVNDLVATTVNEIRASQETLDEKLRNEILLRAFRYEPANFAQAAQAPTRTAIEQYRNLQATVENVAAGLHLPVGELQAALTSFFEKMNMVVDTIERSVEKPRAKKASGLAGAREADLEIIEWTMNRPQVDRILNHIHLLEAYVADRARLHEPIERFLALANGFLAQTKKQLVMRERGLAVVLNQDVTLRRSISALSSGERQIVIMLAHLSLNKRLAHSGIFIVDEPELSLHIGWQERFVDAIREANPTAQLIMATHSPAIIMDKIENARSLS